MVLPAGGLAYTALELPEARLVYGGGALVSVLGACVFAVALVWTVDLGLVAALALVAAGQTAGIVDAARR
jgi:hypothetical protein